jgi:hypothetical protein
MLKKIRTILFVLMAMFIGHSASAQLVVQQPCVLAPVIIGQGYQGGSPCVGGQPQYNGGQYVQTGVQYVQAAQLLGSVGSGLSKCEVVGGIAGGTLGSLAKNYTTQATILSGILGGVVGSALCNNNQGQRVLLQGPQAGAVTLQQGQVPTQIFIVQTGGQQAGQQVIQAQQQQVQQASPQPPPANFCAPGLKLRKFDFPGQPFHGKTLCALPNDTNFVDI